MSNSGNQGQGQSQQQQQQGFYGNSGFNTAANGDASGGGGGGGNGNGPPPQPQQGQPSQNNGVPATTAVSASGPPSVGGPPSNLNTNVPTPGSAGQAGTASSTNATTTSAPSTTTASTGALAQALAAPTTSADGTMASQTQPATMNPQQQQQAKELNAASLCRYGQETVQEIVSRTQELYQTLRGAQPPDGKMPTQAMDRKPKFQETLRNIRGLYKRLRVIYDKIEESFPSSNDLSLEEKIPYSDREWEPMNEKRDTEAFRLALEEYEEVKEMVIFKNRHLRETMDLMRNIIWDINTMLAMRKE